MTKASKRPITPLPDDYDRAAEILDERGWIRNRLVDYEIVDDNIVVIPDGAVCAYGAICCAVAERKGLKTAFITENTPRRNVIVPEATAVAVFGEVPAWYFKHGVDGIDLVIDFNDTKARDKRMVKRRLLALGRAERKRLEGL